MNKATSRLLGGLLFVVALVLLVGGAFWLQRGSRENAKRTAIVAPLLRELEEHPCAACREPVAQQCSPLTEICRCAEAAARMALDLDRHGPVLGLLERLGEHCQDDAALAGVRAETLTRAGLTEEALRAAYSAPETPEAARYVQYTLGKIALDKSEIGVTQKHAQQALDHGRGGPAHKLMGFAHFIRNEFSDAAKHFESALAANPYDVEAAINAAVCQDRLGKYRGAREGYLRVLQLDPKHAQARYFLAVLTGKAGATQEARHHATKLAELVPPDDERLGKLHTALQASAEESGAGQPAGAIEGRRPSSP